MIFVLIMEVATFLDILLDRSQLVSLS